MDAFVYFSLRDALEEAVEETLQARMELAVELATARPPDEAVERLGELGIRATIELADGRRLASRSAIGQLGQSVSSADDVSLPAASLRRALPDGITVTVFATRAGIEATLDNVLLLEVVGSGVAIGLSVLVLRRTSRSLLRPIDEVVRVARRIASGEGAGRLDPDQPDTELGRMAAAFDDMLDALSAAIDESNAAERRSRRFLADAAHQLRTPIAGLRASLESLMRTTDPAERERLIDNLAREATRLGWLVNSLLRLADLDRNQPPTRLPTDLLAVARTEAERAATMAPSLDVQVLADEPEVVVEVDPEGLKEALANLLDNARRHARATIAIELERSPSAIDLRVRDDGPGPAPEHLEAIFERFVSLDGQRGSGLGLAIARSIARTHGGDVTYEAGAFVLRLPATGEVTTTR